MVLGVIGGLLLGVIGALRHNSLADSGAAFLAVLGVSVPNVLAPLAQYWLAFRLGTLPPGLLRELVALRIALDRALHLHRRRRGDLHQNRDAGGPGQDYVTLAGAKGLSKVAVVTRHVLRNSMIPLITIIVPLTAALLTGTLIVETVFAIPGIGEQFVRSIQVNDFSMIIGTTMLFSVFFVASYLIQDILYGIVDPRIRVAGHRE